MQVSAINSFNSINRVSNLQHFEGKKKKNNVPQQSNGFMHGLKGYVIPLVMVTSPLALQSCRDINVSALAQADATAIACGNCNQQTEKKYPDVLDSLNYYRYIIGVPSDNDLDGEMADGIVTNFFGQHEYRNKPSIELEFDKENTKEFGNDERVFYKKIETESDVKTETPFPMELLKKGNPYIFVDKDGNERSGVPCVRVGDMVMHSRGGNEVAIYKLQSSGDYNGKFQEVCTLTKGYEDDAVFMEVLGGMETELINTKATVEPKEVVFDGI